MQFIINAYDAKDGLENRMRVRPAHLENIQKINGKVMSAGGILDEEGKPKGSFLVMEFASRELLEDYLEHEPYIIEHVWEKVDVEVCNTVILDGKMLG